MLCEWESETSKSFGFIKKLIKFELPLRMIWKADVLSIIPMSEQSQLHHLV